MKTSDTLKAFPTPQGEHAESDLFNYRGKTVRVRWALFLDWHVGEVRRTNGLCFDRKGRFYAIQVSQREGEMVRRTVQILEEKRALLWFIARTACDDAVRRELSRAVEQTEFEFASLFPQRKKRKSAKR
jgi:hypothetical protein